MMDWEEKAKLAGKLSSALHQAPDHPEVFATVIQQVLRSNNLHITDLAITIGDTTKRLQHELEAARRNARPTIENLMDLAERKIRLGRSPDNALADALGVPTKKIAECRRYGIVPRAWFDKINALPDIGDTKDRLDAELARVVEGLSERGYSPEAILELFSRIRATRTTLKQITKVVHGRNETVAAPELRRIQEQLFGHNPEAARRFRIWLGTQLRRDIGEESGLAASLNPQQAKRLQDRFQRELRMRAEDPVYHAAASAAELIQRPLAPGGRSQGADLARRHRQLGELLNAIFPDGAQEKLAKRLAQLTGLDDRHTLDLIKGANRVGDGWWAFLEAVNLQLRPQDGIKPTTEHAPETAGEIAPMSVQFSLNLKTDTGARADA